MSPILYWVKASSKDTGIRTARCFHGFASSMLTITLNTHESYPLAVSKIALIVSRLEPRQI